MFLLPVSVGEGIVFRASRSSVHPFVRSDIVITIFHERYEQYL